MAVVNLKSKAITNRDATPAVLSNPAIQNAEVRAAAGVVAVGATDSSTSTYRFCSIPSNARITSMFLSTDAAGGGSSAGKLGLYDVTSVNSGAIIGSGDHFGTAIDVHTAALVNVNEMHHSGASAQTIANGEKMVWEILSLTSDPAKFYDIVLTLTADNTTTGFNAQLQVLYVV